MLLAVGVKGPAGAPVAPTIKASEPIGDHRHGGSFASHGSTIAQEVVGPGGNGHFQEKIVKFGPNVGAFPVFVLQHLEKRLDVGGWKQIICNAVHLRLAT